MIKNIILEYKIYSIIHLQEEHILICGVVHQQQEKHNHPRKVLVDVKMLVWVLPGVAPLEAFDGRA